jgi:hypothetical protein
MKYTESKQPNSRHTVKLADFPSITEFNTYMDDQPVNRYFQENRGSGGEALSSERTNDARWSGTPTYKDAAHLLATGWTTFAQKIAARVKPSTVSAPVKRSRPTFGMVGSQASVPLYLQGVPNNMIDRKMEAQKQKIIVINKGIDFSAMVSSETIEEEGIKAIQVIQALENKGYRVKLNVFWSSTSGDETICFRVTIKKPEERLSLTKVAFPLAHPAMLRRVGFRFLERCPFMTKPGFTGGYGMPDGERMKKVFDQKDVFIPSRLGNVDEFIKSIGR